MKIRGWVLFLEKSSNLSKLGKGSYVVAMQPEIALPHNIRILFELQVQIVCVKDAVLSEPFKGSIRKEDVRATEKDRVEMYKSFR